MAARLHVLLARKAPVGVVFRRGPSPQVLMCRWRTDTDEILEGQWLKGRVYARRCDLSPSGDRLVYFAGKFRTPLFTWTAVSRPPYFTAVALWPKDDAWGGGGLFASESDLAINHRPEQIRLEPGFELPGRLRVGPLGEWSGRGEDSPIWDERLRRDGWTLEEPGRRRKPSRNAKLWIELDPATRWSRPEPARRPRFTLVMAIEGIFERGGPLYVVSYAVRDREGEPIELGRCDWADWALDGDLLVAKEGRLLRLARGKLAPRGLEDAMLVADLNDRAFVNREPPAAARTWFSGL